MRIPASLGLGLFAFVLAPAAALAGGHAPATPGARVIRVAPVIQAAPRPVYAPPARPVYGPPRNAQRHAWRHRGQGGGFIGYPAVYQAVAEPAEAAQPAAPSGEYLRPRATIVYNYAGGPPLWQGDAGYVAQPVIYNVQTVLRRYPLTGMEPSVVK